MQKEKDVWLGACTRLTLMCRHPKLPRRPLHVLRFFEPPAELPRRRRTLLARPRTLQLHHSRGRVWWGNPKGTRRFAIPARGWVLVRFTVYAFTVGTSWHFAWWMGVRGCPRRRWSHSTPRPTLPPQWRTIRRSTPGATLVVGNGIADLPISIPFARDRRSSWDDSHCGDQP